MKIGGFIALLMAGVGLIVALPFLPIIQGLTDINAVGLNTVLNATAFASTPLAPIMRLWNVWGLALLIICVVIIFIGTSRRT